MLTTYFGDLRENLDLALELPVAGLHVDLVRGPRAGGRDPADEAEGHRVLARPGGRAQHLEGGPRDRQSAAPSASWTPSAPTA